MRLLALSFFFFCFLVQASEPIRVHLHELKLSGVLPEPYRTIDLSIELDEDTGNVIFLDLYRGQERLTIPQKIIDQLTDVNINTLSISHEMHRIPDFPTRSEFEGEGDWLHINMSVGNAYRAHRFKNKVEQYLWGYDSLRLTITKNNKVSLSTRKVSEQYLGWANLK